MCVLQPGIRRAGSLPLASQLPVSVPHPSDMSKGWIASCYFGKFNRARWDRWVFGDHATGAYLTNVLLDRQLSLAGSAFRSHPVGVWPGRR